MAASQQNRDHGIAVKGVTRDITEDDLMAAFGFAGNIQEVFLKAERGYAFVTFAATGSVAQAVEGAPAEVAGVAVRVEARTPALVREEAPVSVNVYINGLADGTTAEHVQAGVAPFGAVDLDAIFINEDKNITFVAFETEDAASAAVAAAGTIVINGQATGACEFRRSSANRNQGRGRGRKPRARKQKEIPENGVYIKNVPEDCTDADIEDVMGAFGTVINVETRAGRDFAFVTFDGPDGANAAVKMGESGDGWLFEHRTGRKPAAAEAKE